MVSFLTAGHINFDCTTNMYMNMYIVYTSWTRDFSEDDVIFLGRANVPI